jgi:rhodanese-related sulfurtransferase
MLFLLKSYVMKKFSDLVKDLLPSVREIMPWDLVERLEKNPQLLLLDIREPYEFSSMRIDNSMNVPRGILETACEYDFEETVPELVKSRDREIVVICRSGNRSVLSAYNMQIMGYNNVCSLKTGLRGWAEYEQPLVDSEGNVVDVDRADDYFQPKLRPEQLRPTG